MVIAPGRKHRADFKVSRDLLVEVDGGSWSGGRHTRGKGFADDCEKASLAAIAGYRVIHCTTEQVDSEACAEWVQEALR